MFFITEIFSCKQSDRLKVYNDFNTDKKNAANSFEKDFFLN